MDRPAMDVDGCQAGSGRDPHSGAGDASDGAQSPPPGCPTAPSGPGDVGGGGSVWWGRPLFVALGVAAEDALCVSPHWHATVDALTRTPLVTVEPVIGIPRAPWRVEDRSGLGDFRDVRQLRGRRHR
jgi:hypothetical protein